MTEDKQPSTTDVATTPRCHHVTTSDNRNQDTDEDITNLYRQLGKQQSVCRNATTTNTVSHTQMQYFASICRTTHTV